MIKTAFIFILLFACLSFAENSSSVQFFKYRPELIETGVVYHYTKSNLDGSKPSTVSIYVADRDNLEVYKAETNVIDAAYVLAKINWEVFSAETLNSNHLLKDGAIEHVAQLELLKMENAYRVKVAEMEEVTKISHYPVHVYNFDFISFNYTLRHLIDPRASFEVAIMDPTFQPDGKLFEYKGKVRIQYQGDEKMHNQDCRKYSVGGEAFQGKTGTMWVNKKGGYIENIEVPYPDNPDWNSFKFELKKIEKMTPDQWKKYMAENIGRKPFP